MTNFILSIFLCLAMVFNGVGNPADLPATETTWTLDDVALRILGEEYALDPEARVTATVDADSAALHFELGIGDQTALPIAVEVARDALRASFGSGERVYTLTEAELWKLLELSDDEAAELSLRLDGVSEFYQTYGALMGSYSRDPERALELSDTFFRVLIVTCGGAAEAVDVEVDGASVSAKRREMTLNTANTIALLDQLAGCGIPEVENLVTVALDMANQAAGTNYESFSEALEVEPLEEDFSFPLTLTTAQTDDLDYVCFEGTFDVQGSIAMNFREEIISRDAETHMRVLLLSDTTDLDGALLNSEFQYQLNGPFSAPTSVSFQGDASITMPSETGAQDAQYIDMHMEGQADFEQDPEGGLVRFDYTLDLAGEDDAYAEQQIELRMAGQIDENQEQGGGDVRLELASLADDAEELPILGLSAEWDRQGESDGSVTTAVALAISADAEELFALSFDLNRAEAPAHNLFEGMEEIPITVDAIEALIDGEATTPEAMFFQAAMMADATRTMLDATRLLRDPSIQALIENFAWIMDGEILDDVIDPSVGIIGGADGLTSIFVTGPNGGVEA